MSEEPYFVEVDRVGCSSCGKGTTWTVIGPQGSQHSESWGSEEEAANFAECMNEAYANGLAAALSPKTPSSEPESRSIQRRKALQKGEAMPKFTDHSIEIAEVRAALKEAEWWEHLVGAVQPNHKNGFVESCMYCQRLATLRARLAELEKKAEEKP